MSAETVRPRATRRSEGPVVVGCDGSWESLEAVDVGAQEALWRGVPLVLLTVEDETGHGVRGLAEWVRGADVIAQEARAVGLRALDRCGARVDDVSVVTVTSPAAPELDELACAAAVLVLGRHGASGRVAFAAGSTSDQLVRRFGCPVLVAGPRSSGSGEPARVPTTHQRAVVVGLDDSPAAEGVLGTAVHEAQRRGWPLTVVHAVGWLASELHVEASAIWSRHADLLLAGRSPDHSLARVVVDADPPVEALLNHAERDDLIVVGTRGEGRLAGLTRGSVARGVLDGMRCDVLVVPRAFVEA